MIAHHNFPGGIKFRVATTPATNSLSIYAPAATLSDFDSAARQFIQTHGLKIPVIKGPSTIRYMDAVLNDEGAKDLLVLTRLLLEYGLTKRYFDGTEVDAAKYAFGLPLSSNPVVPAAPVQNTFEQLNGEWIDAHISELSNLNISPNDLQYLKKAQNRTALFGEYNYMKNGTGVGIGGNGNPLINITQGVLKTHLDEAAAWEKQLGTTTSAAVAP